MENIVTIWDRRIKNEQIMRSSKAALKQKPKPNIPHTKETVPSS
jgi:hypothetical protein